MVKTIYLVIEGEVKTDLTQNDINYNNTSDWALVEGSSPEKALAFAKYIDDEANKFGSRQNAHPVGRKAWEMPEKIMALMDKHDISEISPEALIKLNPAFVFRPMQAKYK